MLRPCPFCGSKANLYETEGKDWVVECTGKKCEVLLFDDMDWGLPNYDAKTNVIKKWNTRKRSPK